MTQRRVGSRSQQKNYKYVLICRLGVWNPLNIVFKMPFVRTFQIVKSTISLFKGKSDVQHSFALRRVESEGMFANLIHAKNGE